MNKLTEQEGSGIAKIFRDNMIRSLLEFDDPRESAQRLRDALPWDLGDSESGEAMNQGIREAAEIIIRGGAAHEI